MQPLGLNESLLIWINQDWANPVFDLFFTWISMKAGFSFPLLLGITLYIWWRYGKIGWQFGLLLFVLAGLGDGLGSLLKDIFQQARPCLEYYDLIRAPFDGRTACNASTSGMPSNHALNFFSIFTFLCCFFPKPRVILASLSIASLVGLSRIYLGEHFPTQVLAGSGFGVALGVLFAGLIYKLLPNMRFHDAPKLDHSH